MSARAPLPCDIAIVGIGIVGVHQLTHEAEAIIRRCRQTFFTDTGLGVGDYLATLCPVVTDLAEPTEVRPRIDRYRRVASRVVDAALTGGPVCLAVDGHPTMYSYPTALIRRAAAVLDLTVLVRPGISFLDTLLADLGVDPGFDGLQLYEATDLLVRRRPLQPDVPCVVAQAGMVLDPYDHPTERPIGSLAQLQAYLLEFYPVDHPVTMVTSPPHPLLPAGRQTVRLGSLAAALAAGAHLLGTLFIPPVTRRPIADERLAGQLRVPVPATAATTPPRREGRPAIGPQPVASEP